MRIFISYRRDDLAARSMVGRIYDRLVKRFGATKIFVDEHAVPPGVDFREVLAARLKECDVVFALIGPQWLDLLTARGGDQEDHLVFELRTALENNMRVVPVLLSDAKVPPASSLPESISRLAFLNGHEIDSGPNFDDQLNRLLRAVDTSAPSVARRAVLAAMCLAVVGAVATFFVTKWQSAPTVKSVSVQLVMGENVEYERVIAKGFLDRLRGQLGDQGIELIERPLIVPRFKDTYASPKSEAGRQIWKDIIEDIIHTYSPGEIDYFVTLGTFATTALTESEILHYLNPKGLIYLGVTDPQRSGFVGIAKVAGVKYGTGGMDYGKTIAELFPDNQRLVFIYQSTEENIQDLSIAAALNDLNAEIEKTNANARKPRFEIHPINKLIEIGDLEEANPDNPSESAVYFAWYGLDNILSLENRTSLEREKLWIIPSTYSPRNFRAAGLIVSVDDAEVGKLGADIVLKHLSHPTLDLAKEPIQTPGFRVWINRETLKKKRLRLLDKAYDRTDDPSYSYDVPVN